MVAPRIPLPLDRIADVCRRYHVRRIALFGSILRDDFRPDSDIDLLYDLEPDSHITLFDVVALHDELEDLLKRRVDLVSRRAVEVSRTPTRRNAILSTAQVLYEA